MNDEEINKSVHADILELRAILRILSGWGFKMTGSIHVEAQKGSIVNG